MKPEIATMWADALESGKYQQAIGVLETEGGNCCLGVLCRLAIEAGVEVEVRPSFSGERTLFDDEGGTIPISVKEWSGMRYSNGAIGYDFSLSAENDSGVTFPEIAQIIRERTAEL